MGNYFRKQIKKEQSKVNKILHEVNTNVVADDLWRGRFYVKQIDRRTGVWSDGSGVWMAVILKFYDKKTHQAVIAYCDVSQFFASHMWLGMNNFIVDEIAVWENESRDEVYHKDKFDYSTVDIVDSDYKIINQSMRFY